MIWIPNIIVPELGLEALRKTMIEMQMANEAAFALNREMLIDFYCSQQTDQPRYLKDFFNREADPAKPGDYPHNLVLTQANITSKLIDKKAKNYITQPIRQIDGQVDDDYTQLLIDGGIKTSSKLVDRFTWLLGDHCVVVIADEDKKTLRFDNPFYYRPVFANGDNFNPVGVMYPVGLMLNADKQEVQAWVYWDELTHVYLEAESWDIIPQADNPNNENEHGVFNALFTHRIKPFRSHWTKDAQDLLDTNRDINIALTSINNALRYVGFPILVAAGLLPENAAGAGDEIKADTNKPAVKIGFDKILYVTSPVDGKTVSVDFLQPNVQWDQLVGIIKSRIELLSMTWNVDIRWEMSGNLASGVALKILSIDNTDDLNEIQELYEEFFEVPLFKLVQKMGEKISWLPKVKGKTLTLDWGESGFVESPKEKSDRLASEFNMNLSNPIEEIKKDNPDLDDQSALMVYLKNARINKLLKSSQITSAEALDIILNPPDDNEPLDIEALVTQIQKLTPGNPVNPPA